MSNRRDWRELAGHAMSMATLVSEVEDDALAALEAGDAVGFRRAFARRMRLTGLALCMAEDALAAAEAGHDAAQGVER